MSNPTYPALCPDCLQPLTVSWPQQKHECKAVAVGPVLTCIPSKELDRLRAEVASLNKFHAEAMNEAANEFNTHHEEMLNLIENLTQQLAAANENVRLMAEQSLKYQEAAHAANGRAERYRAAIQQTLDENGHLADGEVCTLILLKRALSDLPEADKEKS